MGAAEEFFGQSFSTVKQAVDEVTTTVEKTASKALSFFGIDFSSKKENKSTVEPSKPVTEPVKANTFDTIFTNLIQAESKGKHTDEKGNLIKSKRGAEGVTQLMPHTAKNPGYGIIPVKDKSEEEYTRVGKEYLQKMYDKFKDWEKALAAYNAGVGNVMKAESKAERFGGDWKEYLPKKEETIPYIEKILNQKEPMKVSGLFDKKDIRPGTGTDTTGIRG